MITVCQSCGSVNCSQTVGGDYCHTCMFIGLNEKEETMKCPKCGAPDVDVIARVDFEPTICYCKHCENVWLKKDTEKMVTYECGETATTGMPNGPNREYLCKACSKGRIDCQNKKDESISNKCNACGSTSFDTILPTRDNPAIYCCSKCHHAWTLEEVNETMKCTHCDYKIVIDKDKLIHLCEKCNRYSTSAGPNDTIERFHTDFMEPNVKCFYEISQLAKAVNGRYAYWDGKSFCDGSIDWERAFWKPLPDSMRQPSIMPLIKELLDATCTRIEGIVQRGQPPSPAVIRAKAMELLKNVAGLEEYEDE